MPYKSKAKKLEYDKRYYREHKDEINAHNRERYRTHPEVRERNKEWVRQWRKTPEYKINLDTYLQKKRIRSKCGREKVKKVVFMHYSNNKMECARCGYNNIDALCLDHINDNGHYERTVLNAGRGSNFYQWLKNRGFPSGYQVLCHNCNYLKELERRKNRGKGQVFVQQRI